MLRVVIVGLNRTAFRRYGRGNSYAQRPHGKARFRIVLDQEFLSFSNGNCVEIASLAGGGIGAPRQQGLRWPGSPLHLRRVAGIPHRGA